jgi:glycosyltransferase involved in cell wall biosynthesis
MAALHMSLILLTVSGSIDPEAAAQVERGERPLPDYLAMARAFDADLLDYAGARQKAGRFGRLLERLGSRNLMLAWACFIQRKQYRVIFTDGEQIGIPLALLLKFISPRNRPAHLMIAHILSVPKKQVFFDLLHVQNQIDRILVYATWQRDFIRQRWGLPPEQVIFTPFMVDARFFSPDQARPGDPLGINPGGRPLICAVGLEFRDYPTLIEAVRGLDVQLVIAAASPWSKREDTTEGQDLPDNVLIRRFSQYDLRDLYAASRLMVMPLYPVEFQAGVTAILEALAMERAVVCTRTPGQTDVITSGVEGVYVEPGDSEDLHRAIQELLDQPLRAREMGVRGRQLVLDSMSLDCYVERLGKIIAQARGYAGQEAVLQQNE